jgi:hypothetical protein
MDLLDVELCRRGGGVEYYVREIDRVSTDMNCGQLQAVYLAVLTGV